MATYNNTNDTNDIYYATATPVPPPNAPAAMAAKPPPRQYSLTTAASTKAIDGSHVKQLKEQGYTEGLAYSINELKYNFPLRMWVVDNSGSMGMTDGNRFIPSANNRDMKMIPCTRWNEIQDCVNYHVQLSALLTAPTVFRLLNNPGISAGAQEFDVATKGEELIPSDVDNALNIMTKARPSGCTPLTDHIKEIHATVTAMKDSLESQGKRVVIVLATDGLPTNSFGECNTFIKNQFVQSLRGLEGLPVWIVIRLSTDEEDVVDFYNNLDDQLELSMDVLDDFCGEAAEIYEHNPWMNYGLPLHRLREMGFHDRVLDMIDERPLTKGEIRDFCLLLFGVDKCDALPDPGIDWDGFVARVKELLSTEELQWNPMKKKLMPWINLKKLEKQYGESACMECVMM
jgi:hypothetical protein